FGGRLAGPLGGERRALAAALEADGAGRGAAKGVAVGVGNGDDRVVERRLDVRDAPADVPPGLALLGLRHRVKSPKAHRLQPVVGFCYRISFTPFLPATVLRGPLRVRALVLVRWPRTGRLRRW